MAQPKVFISYRREDSKWPARQLYAALCRRLPEPTVFMDFDSIPLGVDFAATLESWVARCDVLLAVIGRGWADARDPASGGRRLDDPADFVRIEITQALRRGIPVVPVLIDRDDLPDADRLPQDLHPLLSRQAEFIRFQSFEQDSLRLIDKLLRAHAADALAPTQTASAAPEPDGAAYSSNHTFLDDYGAYLLVLMAIVLIMLFVIGVNVL